MKEFVATNGVRVVHDWRLGYTVNRVSFPTPSMTALREFFQAERDAELGRWRSKRLPHYVVYPSKGNDDHEAAFGLGLDCVILRETDGAMKGYVAAEDGWPEGRGGGNEWRFVAREYIAAHPVSKPWHDAKPGEVWAITMNGQETVRSVQPRAHDVSTFSDVNYALPGVPVTDGSITAGRRIWPEVQL